MYIHEYLPMRAAAINLRALPEQRDLIDYAASVLGKNRSDFMLEAACERARDLVITGGCYADPMWVAELVAAQERDGLWGGTITLANGWTLALPEMAPGTSLPITVEARRLSGGD